MSPTGKRVVFITGTTSGIGEGLMNAYLKRGDTVVAVNRRECSFESRNPKLISLRADVRSAEEVRRLFERLSKDGISPDVFILNAGIHRVDISDGFDGVAFEEVMETNLNGALRIVAEGLKFDRKKKTFVAVSSTSNILPNPNCLGYYISKLGLTKSFEIFRKKFSGRAEFKTLILGPVKTKMLGSGPMESRLQTLVRDAIAVPVEEAVEPIVRFIDGAGKVFRYTLLSHAVFHAAAAVTKLMPGVYTGSAKK